MAKTIECTYCGKEALQTRPNKEYCSDKCRAKHWREQSKAVARKEVQEIMEKFDKFISQLKEAHG